MANLAGKTLDSANFWRENTGGGWATAVVLLLLLSWKLLVAFSRRRGLTSRDSSSSSNRSPILNPSSLPGTSGVISDSDLRELMRELDVKYQERERWKDVINKKNGSISYYAKCCRPQVGPLKYLSVTIFEKCSTELLRDFYMDNEYRKEWDKTLIEYKQLQADETRGTEIGSMKKKFPFLTPREYILAWRIWEGKDKTFYCVVKDCEHHLAPRQKKFVRVNFFRSGWRIRKVPGRDACEITMLHQEDAGLNVEMAKLAFSRGIWSYVCKMNNALREYSSPKRSRSTSVATMIRLIKKLWYHELTGIKKPAAGCMVRPLFTNWVRLGEVAGSLRLTTVKAKASKTTIKLSQLHDQAQCIEVSLWVKEQGKEKEKMREREEEE